MPVNNRSTSSQQLAAVSPKRKRGGQPGNHNARVHGCYSRALSPAEISEFWQIASQGNAAPELVVLRLKLQYLIRHEPGNRRAFDTIGRLIIKWYRAQYRLSPRDARQLKKVVRETIRRAFAQASAGTPALPFTDNIAATNRAPAPIDASQNNPFLPNESSLLSPLKH